MIFEQATKDRISYAQQTQSILDRFRAQDEPLILEFIQYATEVINGYGIPQQKLLTLALLKDGVLNKSGKLINKFLSTRELLNGVAKICTHRPGEEDVNRGKDIFGVNDQQIGIEYLNLALDFIKFLAHQYPTDAKKNPTKFKIKYDELLQMGVVFGDNQLKPFDPQDYKGQNNHSNINQQQKQNSQFVQQSNINLKKEDIKERDQTMLKLNELKSKIYEDIKVIKESFAFIKDDPNYVEESLMTYSAQMMEYEEELSKLFNKAIQYEGVFNQDEHNEIVLLLNFSREYPKLYQQHAMQQSKKSLATLQSKTFALIDKIDYRDIGQTPTADLLVSNLAKQQQQQQQQSQFHNQPQFNQSNINKQNQDDKERQEREKQERDRRENEKKERERQEAEQQRELERYQREKQQKEEERIRLEKEKEREREREQQSKIEKEKQDNLRKQKQREEAQQYQNQIVDSKQNFQQQPNFQQQSNYQQSYQVKQSSNQKSLVKQQNNFQQETPQYQEDYNQFSNNYQVPQFSAIQQQQNKFAENFDGLSQSTVTAQKFPLKSNQQLIIKDHFGKLVYYQGQSFDVFDNLSESQKKRYKVASLYGKSALINSKEIQIGVKQSLQYVPLKSKNYLNLQIFVGNKSQINYEKCKLQYNGDNTQYNLWLKPEKIQENIQAGEQIKQEVICIFKTYQLRIIELIFNAQYQGKMMTAKCLIPTTLISFINFKEINVQILRTKWKNKRQEIIKSEPFMLNPKIVKGPQYLQKIFPNICEFNSYQHFQEQYFDGYSESNNKNILYKLAGIFDVCDINYNYMIKFIIYPNMMCVIKMISQNNNDLAIQIMNTLIWMIGLP